MAFVSLFFSFTIGVAAFLLFAVQPYFAKLLLPLLGGSPQVWNTCMFFFQFVLLAGYVYSHIAARYLKKEFQIALQFLLFAAALYFLPVVISGEVNPPVNANPIPWLLVTASLTLGVPFFVLSSCSPLLQRWLSYTRHPQAHDPYFLYAASNVGSLAALLAYPFLIEVQLTLSEQANAWRTLFLILFGGIIASGLLTYIFRDRTNPEATHTQSDAAPAVTKKQRIQWVMLSLAPSSLIYGVTTYLTTDIAAIPLLWIVPLAIYLLTFILAFSRFNETLYQISKLIFPYVIIPLTVVLLFGPETPMFFAIGWHLLSFFVMGLYCHGRLALSRPAPQRLTEFYLWISIGGVLGGVFNAIIAPLFFSTPIEYQLTIILACLLRTDTEELKMVLNRWLNLFIPVLLGLLLLGITVFGYYDTLIAPNYMGRFLYLAIPILIVLSFRFQPMKLALGVACLLFIWNLPIKSPGIVETSRSFFGVHRIKINKTNNYNVYLHGNVIHGIQSFDPKFAPVPSTYYHPSGPAGDIFTIVNLGENYKQIGHVGLGIGSLAAYALPHQNWKFYEIDPEVHSIALNTDYFNFLSNCKAPYEVILGDGRLNMAKEKDNTFDLITIDAFSSDSIPVHMVTREAMEIYLSKLTARGILAFHISNSHLNLEPIFAALAESFNLTARVRHDMSNPRDEANRITGKQASSWLVIVKDPKVIMPLMHNPEWKKPEKNSDSDVVWTDNYSNILSLLRKN